MKVKMSNVKPYQDYVKDQLFICKKSKVEFIPPNNFTKIGIALNVKDGIAPLNGLRHPIEGDTNGWYIWAGEDFSYSEDFFVPLHVEHLETWCPEIIKFLGLPPGWRFLKDENYEDVWYDASLLMI